MTDIIFLHGAGAGAYDEDAHMVADLARHLDADDTLDYPRLPEQEPGEDAWLRAIGHAFDRNAIPGATVRTVTGGHQLGNDLSAVAADIRAVAGTIPHVVPGA